MRERLTSYLPFVVVALVGQLSVAWPPGPVDRGAFWISTLLLLLLLVMLVVRRGAPPKTFVVGAALYMTSVSYLMVAANGMGSGLGILLFVPLVGIALYGKPWETVLCVGFLLGSLFAVTVATSSGAVDTTALVRRLVLTGAVAAMLSVAIHLLRGRLVESERAHRQVVATRGGAQRRRA